MFQFWFLDGVLCASRLRQPALLLALASGIFYFLFFLGLSLEMQRDFLLEYTNLCMNPNT
jgi:hypothetical protein